MLWANQLNLSYNMWGDWANPKVKGKFWQAQPHLRFDEKLWNDLLAAMAKHLVITEKPSVARDIVAALGKARPRDKYVHADGNCMAYEAGTTRERHFWVACKPPPMTLPARTDATSVRFASPAPARARWCARSRWAPSPPRAGGRGSALRASSVRRP